MAGGSWGEVWDSDMTRLGVGCLQAFAFFRVFSGFLRAAAALSSGEEGRQALGAAAPLGFTGDGGKRLPHGISGAACPSQLNGNNHGVVMM